MKNSSTQEQDATLNELPEQATEEVVTRWENGAKKDTVYRIDDEIVWFRYWEETGQLYRENGQLGDQIYGPYRIWHPNGKLQHETFYYHGKENGVSRQYDEEGNLISTYTMRHGTGLDLWYQKAGVLSEEREYLDGDKHGFERWYWEPSDDGTIWQEGHYKHYEEHGIFREWNTNGRLRRGFPQYFVDGVKVTKRQYITASKRDTSLPPYREEDNDFHRAPLQEALD